MFLKRCLGRKGRKGRPFVTSGPRPRDPHFGGIESGGEQTDGPEVELTALQVALLSRSGPEHTEDNLGSGFQGVMSC